MYHYSRSFKMLSKNLAGSFYHPNQYTLNWPLMTTSHTYVRWRPRLLVRSLSAACFGFTLWELAHGKSSQLDEFSLLKPFLTFRSHITTVLIAQNVAKAKINDLLAYYFTQKPFVYSYYRLEDILPTLVCRIDV